MLPFNRGNEPNHQQGPRIALAELGVGEGGLPDGARQFSNFVKVKKDWAALGASIKGKGADVTAEEWKNVALFLRKVYQLGGELEFLAGTFPSDKKKSALALVRSIQVWFLVFRCGGGGGDGLLYVVAGVVRPSMLCRRRRGVALFVVRERFQRAAAIF